MGPAAHVFLDDLARPELSDEDRRHLERVLRLRPGEEVTAADGRGGWGRFRFGRSGRLEADGEIEQRDAPQPPLAIAFALTKGERPEWTVQKLTEAGVDHIAPFFASRSVVRWDGEKGNRQVVRLRAVARSAAMQSRRVRLPTVYEMTDFAGAVELAGRLGAGSALAHMGGMPPSLERPAILVGPEGGFSEDELAGGLPTVGLGAGVLRSETAAVAAAVLLSALRAGVVRPAG